MENFQNYRTYCSGVEAKEEKMKDDATILRYEKYTNLKNLRSKIYVRFSK